MRRPQTRKGRRAVLVSAVGLVLVLLNTAPAFAQPANDELSGATPLTLNTTVTQDTSDATSSPTDPTYCTGFTQSNTVWFSFTATESQRLELDASGSNYGVNLTALTDLGSGLAVIACGGSYRPMRFDATAGKTYFFMAGGYYSAGLLQLTLRPGPVMTVTIDPTGTVDRQGVADVSGTLSCNRGIALTRLDVTLRQRVSKTLVIEGSKTFYPLCPTTPAPWSATIIGTNGPFTKGQAEVFATGYACIGEFAECPTEARSLVDLLKTKT
jgi:hypothetical protein